MQTSKLLITDRKIRMAIVGCGKIAEKHLLAIDEHKANLELVALCDTNKAILEQAIATRGVDGFSNYEQMLEQSNADVVVLCSPSGLHASQTIKAAYSGKHIITEKPMATRWQDGLEMVKVCDDEGVRLFVVKQNRHHATLRLLKEAINKKRFGKIYHVNLNVYWTRPQSYYDVSRWRGTWEHDGGALMNQASHYVDLLTWLIGPVQSVQAMMATLGRDIEVEDTSVMNIKWRSGAIGSMNVTMLTYPKNLEGSITILGEKGSVKLGGLAVNEILHWEFEDKQPEDELIKKASADTTAAYGNGHPLYYQNVINVFQGLTEPETDGREGLKSLELLIATYLSARDGQTISLPLEY